MGSPGVVEAEIAADRGASLRDAGIGAEMDLLVLHGPPERLDEDVVTAWAPLPSLLMATSALLSTLTKSALVNRDPWSVVKISGRPWRAGASCSASMRDRLPPA